MDTVSRFPIPVTTRAPGGRTNAYLIGGEPAVLIDPAGRSPALDAAVGRCEVTDLLVTHTHPDHVGALSHYADRTGGRVWAHSDFVDRFVERTGTEPDRCFEDGTRITFGGTDLRVLETPGHAPDHVACAIGTVVLVGDLAVAEGSVAVVAGEGDLRTYLDSLFEIRSLDAECLFPGHGEPIDDPEAAISRLIDHRLQREKRVREAIENGAEDVGTITDRAYDKNVSAVRDLAEGTIEAHIVKLAQEGVLDWDGERITAIRGVSEG